MKTYKLIILFFLSLLTVGCENQPELYDFEKYKFVSFIDKEYALNEDYSAGEIEQGNDPRFPIYLQYDGSVLEEDFTVELGISESFSQQGVDYSFDSTTVLFKAGSIRSEPIYLTLIDNIINDTDEKSLVLTIESVSNLNVDIGVGIINQANKEILIHIVDNECSSTIDIFNGETLSNETSSGTYPALASVTGDAVAVQGDLIGYSAFPNASLEITLTPVEIGAKIGSASFNQQITGTDNDGYVYAFKQVGEGTYDVCSQTIEIEYDVLYQSGSNWVYWYTISNSFLLE
jgi:hypothetical protein